MKKIILFTLVMALMGCATVSTRLQSALAPAANIGDSVTCQNECKAEWQRAQLWLAKHSKWKIQTATDVLIQTFNPTQYDPSYGFSVMKEPVGSGTYVIRMELFCGNLFGCDPKPLDVKKALFYYVKTGVDLLQGQGYLSGIR